MSVLFKQLPNLTSVLPKKAHPSDVGIDITITRLISEDSTGLLMYGTGLAAKPPPGTYLMLVPRSSFTKSQHFMPHSVGVIDPDYRGELMVPVRKCSPEAPNLEVPGRHFQLLLMPLIPCTVEAVSELDSTERGEGGFGSTG